MSLKTLHIQTFQQTPAHNLTSTLTMSKQQSIAALEGILAYSFEDPNISWLALQAAGSGIGGPDGNKTLAMIGDAIMKFILVVDLAKRGLSRGLSPFNVHWTIHELWLIYCRCHRFYNTTYCIQQQCGASLQRYWHNPMHQREPVSIGCPVAKDSSRHRRGHLGCRVSGFGQRHR